MFKIGFHSFITKPEMEIAKRLNMEVIEVYLGNSTRLRADEVKGLLQEYAIKPCAVLVGSDSQPKDLESFKKDLDFTESIGCPVFVAYPKPLKYSDRESIKAFRDFYKPVCRYAGYKGIEVSVQSCSLDPESWDIMLGEVPELRLKYDPSFSAQAGRNYLAEIVKYASFINHVHSKDEIAVERTTDNLNGITHFKYVPSGMGDIHWGSVIALLYEAGYKGDIAIEPHSEYWINNLEACLRISKRHLEQYIVEPGLVSSESKGQIGFPSLMEERVRLSP